MQGVLATRSSGRGMRRGQWEPVGFDQHIFYIGDPGMHELAASGAATFTPTCEGLWLMSGFVEFSQDRRSYALGARIVKDGSQICWGPHWIRSMNHPAVPTTMVIGPFVDFTEASAYRLEVIQKSGSNAKPKLIQAQFGLTLL